ncbi:hypothetical protein SSBG_03228 [Streptomyces sp. SPB074]|nr:hypothetical protein SSBG_03228 [Streptomyces sp. SPB074]
MTAVRPPRDRAVTEAGHPLPSVPAARFRSCRSASVIRTVGTGRPVPWVPVVSVPLVRLPGGAGSARAGQACLPAAAYRPRMAQPRP